MAPTKAAKASSSTQQPAAKGKGKGKAIVGAPAQPAQRTRKGKKAWRKNIDITAEEVALEEAREEERVTGGKLSTKANDDLFVIDTVGDVAVAKSLRKTKQPLRSLAVLNERSAVPSMSSKVQKQPKRADAKVTRSERDRLLRLARKLDDGNYGTALLSARKPEETLHDAWGAVAPVPGPAGGFGEEGMVKNKPKAPITIQRQREQFIKDQLAAGRATELPNAGVSYNPTVEAHKQLLELAIEEEKEKLRREGLAEERIREMGDLIAARKRNILENSMADYEAGVAEGMKVGDGEVDEEDAGDGMAIDGADPASRKIPGRKTQAQRNKAIRLRENKRLAALDETNRRLHKSLVHVPSFSKEIDSTLSAREQAIQMKELVRKAKAKRRLAGGEKIGKHRVAKRDIAVQLGDDLAESLRQVKPEGNLFRDRFLSLQQRALIEPRVPQLPKRRVIREKEYEKFAWKRFE